MILPAALSGRFLFLMNWCLCVFVALFLTWTVVGGRRFRPTSGHLEFISMSIMIGTATIRTIGRRVEYVGNHQNYRLRSGTCCQVQTSFSPCQWMLLCHRLCRDIAVVLIASIAIWILDILLLFFKT